MKKLTTLLIIFFVILTSYGQGESNIWYFGENAGLDFATGVPVPIFDGQIDTFEGCSVLSDKTGNLLFYSDGTKIWNRNHDVMPNGNGLLGDDSSTHSSVFVPNPVQNNIYYVFTVDKEAGDEGLRYSIVDLNLDGGLGDVVSKNVLLYTPSTEKIAVIRNGCSFWVLTHQTDSNNFVAHKVDATGVNNTPVISSTGLLLQNLVLPLEVKLCFRPTVLRLLWQI